MARLQLVTYNILDVRSTAWYDDFSAFCSAVRGLEVRLSNVMQLAVDSAGSLVARLELLEARILMPLLMQVAHLPSPVRSDGSA